MIASNSVIQHVLGFKHNGIILETCHRSWKDGWKICIIQPWQEFPMGSVTFGEAKVDYLREENIIESM